MWTIKPKTSVGPIRLGMTQTQFEFELGKAGKEVNRFPETDHNITYVYDCIHLTCNEEGVVECISVFRPKQVSLFDMQLLGRPIEAVLAELNANGIVTKQTDVGFRVDAAGLDLIEYEGIVDGIELYLE